MNFLQNSNKIISIEYIMLYALFIGLVFVFFLSNIWKIHTVYANTYKIHFSDLLYIIASVFLGIYVYIYCRIKNFGLFKPIDVPLIYNIIMTFIKSLDFGYTCVLLSLILLSFLIIRNLLSIFRLYILRTYIWCLQWSVISNVIQKVLCDFIRGNIVKILLKIRFNTILPPQISDKLTSWSSKRGFQLKLLFILFIHLLYDFVFNNGITYATSNFLPYYSSFMFIYSIYWAILKRNAINDSIISDAYYRFNSPREEFQEECFIDSFDFAHKYGSKYDLNDNLSFDSTVIKNNSYFTYRITVNTPEYMTKHILYSSILSKEEFFRRKTILQGIILYPY